MDAGMGGLARLGFEAAQAGKATVAANAIRHSPAQERARAVAEDFEAVFISTMLEHMGRDVQNGDGLFGGGQSETMFRSLMNDEYGKAIAAKGGLGIAESIYKFIMQAQEV